MQHAGTIIPVDQAVHTPGALLFSFSMDPNKGMQPEHGHIAISLGNGQTIEARGSKYGVGSFPAQGRFQYAAVIPGFNTPGAAPSPIPPPHGTTPAAVAFLDPGQLPPQGNGDDFA